MNYLFIFVFVLIVAIIALCKWNAMQYIKIKELKRSVAILNKEHNLISNENIELREFIKMQDLFIGEMGRN
jgi:cell division protein FtsB